MKTTLHNYFYDLTNAADKAAWNELRAKLTARETLGLAGHKMHSHSAGNGPAALNNSEPVHIETSSLFENQWNTAATDSGKGMRVFDWFQHYEWNDKKVARGHWLEITEELLNVRRETLKCGYCGAHYGPHHETHRTAEGSFCTACLDSPYLKQNELHLLRLLPLSTPFGEDRPELTAEEKVKLEPLYIERQTTGKDSRAKQARDKQRERVLSEYDDTTTAATEKRDGLLWLWDKGFSLDNVIYYSHTRSFAFGWRQPVSADVASRLLDVMSEFPFDYEIKAEGKSYERKGL